MKKISLTIILLALLAIPSVNAQFIKGYGVTVGVTRSTQIWNYETEILNDRIKQRYKNGLNGSVFMEYFDHDYIRMITEFQYNRKGCIERFPTEGLKDRVTYLCLNNFLKFRQELYDVTPYFLVGPRVEYLYQADPQTYLDQLHVSASAGIGIEFLYTDPWIFFTEFHYNPDVMKSFNSVPLDIRHRAFELRVGLKFARKAKGYCPPAYTSL